MAEFYASPWQVALSALLPVASCLLLFLVEARGPLSAPIQSVKGIVGPYFGSVSILFGLFAALLAHDVWQKTNEAKRTVQAEADTIHVLAHLARAHGLEGLLLPKIRAYVQVASAEQPHSSVIDRQRDATGATYLDLLTGISQVPGLDAASRGAMHTAAVELLRAHDARFYVANDATAPIKWLAILAFGFLTQIAVMMVHVGNRRAMRVAVGLFTVAFGLCLIVVAIFDAPFDIVLHDEPWRTMHDALERM